MNHSIQAWRNPLLYVYTLIVSTFVCSPAIAAITKPTLPDGSAATNNFFADLKKIFKGTGEVAVFGIYVVMWVVAAWLIISGAMEGRRKGDWGNFWLGMFVAAVLVVAGAYFLATAEEALANLK